MRIKHFLIQKKEIILILLFYTVLYSFNLDKFPVINVDENWFVNPAYNLAMFGYMGTSMIFGFYNIANFTYWQPPVYFLLLAGSFKLFGFGVVQARMVGVFLGFLTVLFTYLLGLNLYNKRVGLLASFLLVLNPLFFFISRNARMEIAVACFMVVALYFTFLALKNSKLVYYFAAAFFATLSILSHPNGLIAVLAVLLIILIEKIDFKKLKFYLSFKEISSLILGFVIPLIPYAWYLSLDLAAFKGQFISNIASSPSNPFNNFIMEPTRYTGLFQWFVTYNGMVLTFTVFLVSLILMGLGLHYLVCERRYGDKFLLLVLIVSIGVFSILVYHKYFIYLGIIMPYLSILLSLTFNHKITFKPDRKSINSIVLIFLWVVLIVGNCIFLNNFLEKTKNYDYEAIKEEVQKYIPPGSVVIGDRNYWIALQEEYRYYGCDISYGEGSYQYKIKTTDMLTDLKVEYILFDREVWASEDKYIENFLNQNCTLIGEIPANDTNGYGFIKIYRIKNVSN
ncbi:MAG: glycosyltransferase family 39 protein [Methanobacteriaceae archaeon]|nr:glycosyltransferase family 39 protein [Methanobacteriaceae archaeon]